MNTAFDFLKISGKLLLTPFLIVLFFLLPAAAVYLGLNQQQDSVKSVAVRIAVGRAVSAVTNDVSGVHTAVFKGLAAKKEDVGSELSFLVKEKAPVFDADVLLLQDMVKPGAVDNEEKRLAEVTLDRLREYRKSVEAAAVAARTIKTSPAAALGKSIEERYQALRAALRDLAKQQEGSMAAAIDLSTRELNASARFIGFSFAAAALLALLAGIIVLRKSVASPLKAMENAARKISEGDLSFNVELVRTDEIGRLNHHLHESFAELGQILQRIKELSARISKVVEEVEGESKNVLQGAEKEAAAVAEISSAISELNAASSEIADSTDNLAKSTENASASVEQTVQSISSINGTIHDLTAEVESVSSSIEELSASVAQVAGNAGDLASSSEQTLAAVTEITAAIREVETTIKESARMSEKVAADASTFAITSVEKTIEGMKNIQASVEYTAQFMAELGKRSQEIGKILNVIDEVTERTTLLALNAAIIAAQAGEHGRGFAVVADEMRSLADQTGSSTKEIALLIKAVQDGVNNASAAMQKGTRSVEEGFKLAQEAGTVLKNVVAGSKQSSEMALAVERTTVEQTHAAHLATESMARVKDMTDDIARATAEQSKSVALIMQAAEKMKDAFREMSRATEEQTSSSRQIARAVEVAAEGSVKISRSLAEHKISSKHILNSAEGMKMIPEENRTLIFAISNTLRDLQKDSDLLRTEMERFRFAEVKTGDVLKLGIIPLDSPAEMFRRFGPLADYLSAKLGKKVQLKVGINFEGAIDDIGRHVTDLCFMGAPTFLKAHTLYGTVKVVARALRKGRPYHHAAVVVRADSNLQSLADLKGRTMAFANKISTAGHIIPRMMLADAGISVEDLKYYTFMGHHDDAAKAVLKGDFDAACVMESIALKFMDQGLRILKLSGDIPEFGICCNVAVDEPEIAAVSSALASLNDSTPEGAAIVRSIDTNYTGFIAADDSEYEPIRRKMLELGIL